MPLPGLIGPFGNLWGFHSGHLGSILNTNGPHWEAMGLDDTGLVSPFVNQLGRVENLWASCEVFYGQFWNKMDTFRCCWGSMGLLLRPFRVYGSISLIEWALLGGLWALLGTYELFIWTADGPFWELIGPFWELMGRFWELMGRAQNVGGWGGAPPPLAIGRAVVGVFIGWSIKSWGFWSRSSPSPVMGWVWTPTKSFSLNMYTPTKCQ